METDEIILKADDITLEQEGVAEADGGKNFCTAWPLAKPGLEILRDIIKNPIAKAAIGIVISAGDAVSSKVCV